MYCVLAYTIPDHAYYTDYMHLRAVYNKYMYMYTICILHMMCISMHYTCMCMQRFVSCICNLCILYEYTSIDVQGRCLIIVVVMVTMTM